MWLQLRRGVTLLALYAMALHVTLFGVAPVNATGAVDPFSIICHAPDKAKGDASPGKSDFAPGRAADHCNLCSAAEPPPAPDIALNVELTPPRVLHILRPASTSARAGITSPLHRARGPPSFA